MTVLHALLENYTQEYLSSQHGMAYSEDKNIHLKVSDSEQNVKKVTLGFYEAIFS
jgi:hypothetical protein